MRLNLEYDVKEQIVSRTASQLGCSPNITSIVICYIIVIDMGIVTVLVLVIVIVIAMVVVVLVVTVMVTVIFILMC